MENEILELRKSGFTYEQIMEKLKCSKSIVSYHCRKNSISRYDNSIKISTELVLEIQSYYNDGYSLRKLSKKFGINRSILSKYIVIKKKITSDCR